MRLIHKAEKLHRRNGVRLLVRDVEHEDNAGASCGTTAAVIVPPESLREMALAILSVLPQPKVKP